MSTSRVTRAVAVAALVVVGAAGCQNGDTPADPSPPLATATTAPTSPSSSPAPTSLTPQEQEAAKAAQARDKAYAAAETAYRAWVANYAAAAAAGFDPKKLDSRLATPQLIDYVTKQFKTFQQPGGSGKYTQNIIRMRPARYVKGQTVEFRMCSVTNLRFLQGGKDVTITPDGDPSPVKTQALQRFVGVQSLDGGKTWKSSTIIYPSNEKYPGATCSA